MKFVCDNCQAQYLIADDKIGPRGVKVKCKKCGTVVVVKPTAEGAAPPAAPEPAAPKAEPAPAVRTSSKVQLAAAPAESPAPVPRAATKPKGVAAAPAEPDVAKTTESNVVSTRLPEFDPPKVEVPRGKSKPGGEESVAAAPAEKAAPPPPPPVDPKPAPAPVPANGTGEGHDGVRQLEQELSGAFDGLFGGEAEGNSDDRKPTKVYPPDELDQLRLDPKSKGNGAAPKKSTPPPAAPKAPEKPAAEWYAAIREEQQGPFTMAQMESFWSQGDVGAESLVWRAGMSDWIALKQVTELRGLMDLPQPKKAPVASAPAPAVSSSLSSSLIPAEDPSEETWRPRGMTAVYQAANAAEAKQALLAEAKEEEKQKEDELGWRPTAASALASLVSDELAAVPGKPKSGGASRPPPADDESIDQPLQSLLGGGANPSSPPMSDGGLGALGKSGGALMGASPFVPQPRRSGLSPMMIISIATGGVGVVGLTVLVLVLTGVIGAKPPAPTPVVVAQAPVPQPVPPVAPPPVAAPAQPAPTPTPAAEPAKEPAKEPAARNDEGEKRGGSGRKAGKGREERDEPKKEEAKKEEPKKEEPKKEEPKLDTRVQHQANKDCDPILYPEGCPTGGKGATKGGGGGRETLSKTDILLVVKKNKPDIDRCASEAKKKDGAPAASAIKMTWVVKNSGATSDVAVLSDEFQGSYLGKCLTRTIMGWKFPDYSGEELKPIKFPFKLGGDSE